MSAGGGHVKLRPYEGVQRELFTVEEIAESQRWAQAESREIDLREIRRLARLTQRELATRLGVDQSELSRFERRRDHKLSTLVRVVAAMGGTVEIVVEIGKVMYRMSPGMWSEESPTEQTARRPRRSRQEGRRVA